MLQWLCAGLAVFSLPGRREHLTPEQIQRQDALRKKVESGKLDEKDLHEGASDVSLSLHYFVTVLVISSLEGDVYICIDVYNFVLLPYSR